MIDRARAPAVRILLAFAVWGFAGTAPAFAQASAPMPANNATGVSLTTSLRWTADPKAARYDVYFGTVNPPRPVTRNQGATSYTPESLAASTTYFWQINSRGTRGYSATGTVWKFTTAAAPSIPSNPPPASGASSVPISRVLTWAASANATSYDVRFGTVNPPPIVSSNQTSTQYQPPSALGYSGTYFWSVTARGAGGTTMGPVWSFVTQSAPPTSTSVDRLRLMTWNIQSGTTPEEPPRSTHKQRSWPIPARMSLRFRK